MSSRRMDTVAVYLIGPSGLSESMWSACLARLGEGSNSFDVSRYREAREVTMSSLR